MGHEALAVAGMLMQEGDYLFPYYRDRAMVLARGVPNAELAKVYFAKRDTGSGGRQMPGHYSSREKNIWSVPTPTGANALPACGVAWAMQLQGKNNLVVATLGDAAARQGEFYEAIAFAVERQLPVIFIVEDNQYGISTNTTRFNPFRLGVFSDEIGLINLNARHPDRVFDAIGPAFDRARSGQGPTVIVAELDRLCSHTSSDDHRVYRPQAEIDEMEHRDPILVVAQELIQDGEMTADLWEKFKSEIQQQVDREYQAAESEADPASKGCSSLFGPGKPPPLEGARKWRMVDPVNQVFKSGLSVTRSTFFSEDIADPKACSD
jgi:2-oxoisovalerate dehydrogenase E1 component